MSVFVCRRCDGVPCVCAALEEAGVLRRTKPTPTAMEKLTRRIERLEREMKRIRETP